MSADREIPESQAAGKPETGWTKDRAGAAIAGWSAWYIIGGIIREQASNHHSNYPHTIGYIGGTIFGGLAYLITIRIMRKLP